MRKALRRGLLLLLAASVLAVPAVANGRVLGDLYSSGDDAADARRSGRSLNAVGLTTAPPLAGMTQNDGTLTIPPATTPAAGVTGAAYTNNDLDANTATTLFDIDTMNATVVVQSPANNGLLAQTGKLQVDAGASVGFDISSRNRFGVTQGNSGFATVSVLGRYSFFQVNLLTGKLSRIGGFRADTQVVDLAIPLDQG